MCNALLLLQSGGGTQHSWLMLHAYLFIDFMISEAIPQMWMDGSVVLEPINEVNNAFFASSLAALPPPTSAGVGRGSHVVEHE